MAAATLAVATQDAYQDRQKNIFTAINGAANAMDNSGLQDIFTFNVEGLARIVVAITVATNALAAFAIKAAMTPQGAFQTIKSTTGQFAAPSGVLIDASGDLTTQAVGSGWFVMDVAGMSQIKICANSSAAGGSTLAIVGGGI